jgi:hypothetical protein
MSSIIRVPVHMYKTGVAGYSVNPGINNILERFDTSHGSEELFIDGAGETLAVTAFARVPIPMGCNKLDKVCYRTWASSVVTDGTGARLFFVDSNNSTVTVYDTHQHCTNWSEGYREWKPTSGTIVPYDTVAASGDPAHLTMGIGIALGPTKELHISDVDFYFRRGGGYQA